MNQDILSKVEYETVLDGYYITIDLETTADDQPGTYTFLMKDIPLANDYINKLYPKSFTFVWTIEWC